MKTLPGWTTSAELNAQFEAEAALGDLGHRHPSIVPGIGKRFLERRSRSEHATRKERRSGRLAA